jgi:hypothetical protein
MSFVKALIPGLILTLVVATIIGSNGSTGGFLDIHLADLGGHHFHWSWPLFIAATGLAWGILWTME